MRDREGNGIMVPAGSRFVQSAVLSRSAQSAMLRWILTLAALAALVFVPAGPSRAQSQSTTPNSAPASPTTPAKIAVVETATVTQTASAKPTSPAGRAAPEPVAPKGQHEGIAVHGHWTIEVRNPDGSVVTHRELENSLVGTSTMLSLLFGTAVPGGYQVELGAASGGGPCQVIPSNTSFTDCLFQSSLINPMPSSFGYCLPPRGNCFPLSITANMPTVAGLTGLLLNGTATASQSGTIGFVEVAPITCGAFGTANSSTPPTTFSPSACAASSAAQSQGALTLAPVSPAVQVTTAGQSIAVTVQLSFGSGSASGGLSSATVAAAGSGYSAGETVTVSGGTGGTVSVSSVNVSGGVVAVSIVTPGTGYSSTNGEGTTSTTGSGLTLNIIATN